LIFTSASAFFTTLFFVYFDADVQFGLAAGQHQ